MVPGVRLAIDWGTVRIGVAATDVTGTLCFPLATFRNDPAGLDALVAEIHERSRSGCIWVFRARSAVKRDRRHGRFATPLQV